MWDSHRSPLQEHGHAWEQHALSYLRKRGLTLIAENYRCKGGELDLIMRDQDTVVFVEVRQRADADHGGPLASITPAKVRRLLRAAQTWLLTQRHVPPCRFDIIAIEGADISWIRNAIEAPTEN
ncbi:YraN family protein [Massilia arenosa]|uniref:UPF0102 protein E4L96_18280 n=1 Tax=Zemynaea arenosa TaxID=2561931 RepID=A0A4Y9S2K4_9BURK|nr:YraN family protein [Massilia arenosa]TFW15403.1 YraN family protein [Massilia arenosa]